jgi:hypothetical protein
VTAVQKLLTSRREILLLGSVRESIMTPSKTSSEKKKIKILNPKYSVRSQNVNLAMVHFLQKRLVIFKTK